MRAALAVVLLLAGCGRVDTVPPTASLGHTDPPLTSETPPQDAAGEQPLPWEDIVPDGDPREWRFLVLHHSATNTGSVESIHEAHLQRKDASGHPWKGIGYHFVIGNGRGMGDGDVQPTFRWREQLPGAHAGVNEYNAQGIGICLIGNFDQERPTESQMSSLKQLVALLSTKYGISSENVIGHRDVKATACPGELFPLKEVREAEDRSDQLASRQDLQSAERVQFTD